MDAARLVEGYRSVLKRIYSCEAYYERVKLYLSRTQPRSGERKSGSENQAAVADPRQCARLRHLDRPPGSFRPAALELLEISVDCGHALSPLPWRGHDAGSHGLSLPGDDQTGCPTLCIRRP